MDAMANENIFLLVVKYMEMTQLRNLKIKLVIRRSMSNHLRGLENIMNLSNFKQKYIEMLEHNTWFEVNENGNILILDDKV